MNHEIARLVCKVKGHDWIAAEEIRYEHDQTLAVVGGVEQQVPVTWVCDEVCSRCGGETWWPA